MAIVNTAILATNTTLYTSSGNNAITTVIICNTGVADRTLTLHAVPNGGSAGTVNMIVNTLIVPAGDTVSFDQEKMVLSNGDSLVAVGSGTGLSATVSTLPV
jgi:hypothetical protein